MRHSSLVLGALASLAAPVAGVMAYQSWAPGPAHATDSTASASIPSAAATAPVVRYRPCARPARLEDGMCVTHRVQDVVAPVIGGAPVSAPGPADTDQAAPSDDPTPTHPIHPPQTHHADPTETAGPSTVPTSGPSAEPSCEPSDDESEEPEEPDESDRTAGGLLGHMAAVVSGAESQQSGAASDSACDDDDGDEDEDEDDGEDDSDDSEHDGDGAAVD